MYLIRRRSPTTARTLSGEPARSTRTRSLLQVAGFGLLDVFLFSDLTNRAASLDRAAPPPGLVWPTVGAVALTGMAILLRRHRSPVPVFLLLALLSVVTCQFLPYRPLVLVGCAWFVVTSSRGWRVAAW